MNEILQYLGVGQLGNSILLGLKRRERNIENKKFIAEMQKHPNNPEKMLLYLYTIINEALGLRPLSEVRSGVSCTVHTCPHISQADGPLPTTRSSA